MMAMALVMRLAMETRIVAATMKQVTACALNIAIKPRVTAITTIMQIAQSKAAQTYLQTQVRMRNQNLEIEPRGLLNDPT